MQNGEPVRRPAEIEEITNRLVVHPIANRLTLWLAGLHVRPNTVSVAGMMLGLLAAAAYSRYQDVRYAVAGFILMIAWHVLDGADGQLARLTHTQSQSGKILDGVCDYVTFIAVYAALAATLSERWGGWAWALAAVAGVCHAAQSAAYELQRQAYSYFGLGRASAKLRPPQELRPQGSVGPLKRLFGMLEEGYVRLQVQVIGVGAGFHERLAALLEREPQRAVSIRLRYRETFAPAVRHWSILSANYRTLGIFIGALLGAPQDYFGFEILGLSAILAALSWRQHARCARFLRSVEVGNGSQSPG